MGLSDALGGYGPSDSVSTDLMSSSLGIQGNRRDGHGHHQASGVVTLEAFKVAGDATRFPEHLTEGLQRVATQKTLYFTRSRWRRSNTETADTPVSKN